MAHMFTRLCMIHRVKIPTSIGGVNKHRFVFCSLFEETECLASEAVKSAALSLESVDYVEGSHSLPASVLSVGDGISDDVLEEDFQYASGFLIDEAGDTLDTTSASKTADGGFRNTLDVIS
jgi:hypothetical protein